MPRRIVTARALVLGALALTSYSAAGSEADVQRQLLQREQSQTELRLKMQQQRDRAARPPASVSADLQRRQLERDQQQRLQQFHEQQSRAMVVPDLPATPEGTPGAAERQRAIQGGAEQLNRFGSERSLEGGRADPGSAP